MSFGTNLQFLRRRRGATQEELAERLGVSRQSVSKWESDGMFPEMDTLIRLCELFGCDLDTLVRGDVSLRYGEDAAAYDAHMNSFARSITAGVGLILGGVCLLLALAIPGREGLGTILFLTCVTAAVALFITAGMGHDRYAKRHPGSRPCCPPEQAERFERRFPLLIAAPVCLILVGVIWTVGLALLTDRQALGLSEVGWGGLAALPLMACVAAGATTLVWAGIQKSKYRAAEERPPRTAAEEKTDRAVGALWGCGMIGTTAVFLALGLGLDRWEAARVLYPVAALICVAITIFLRRHEE